MEKTITNSIIDYLNDIPSCKAWKRLNSGMSGTTGFPDVTGVVEVSFYGIRIEIEVKQPGEEPSSLQYSRLREFRKLRCISFWCDGFKDFEKQFAWWVKFYEYHKVVLDYKDLRSKNQFVIKDLKD